MNDLGEELVPVFIPALAVTLTFLEDKKGSPLSKEDVIKHRDEAPCIMMKAQDALKMNDKRGVDIDPENCWHDWQMLRRETGRKPDLDPGPRFDHVKSGSPNYSQAMQDAQASIDKFRAMLPSDGSQYPGALIKVAFKAEENQIFMWLMAVSLQGNIFSGKLFEAPESLPDHQIGDRIQVPMNEVMDWMVNDGGKLSGGYTLRVQRDGMNPQEQAEFDEYIGVVEYLPLD